MTKPSELMYILLVQSIKDTTITTNLSFSYYAHYSGLNYHSFSGTCHNVGKNSGLLVVDDSLEKPLTKISIKLKEQYSKNDPLVVQSLSD